MIRISAEGECTPSLVKSVMHVPAQATAAQELQIYIDAKDEDGLPITEGRGRLISLVLEGLSGIEYKSSAEFTNGRFMAEFSGLLLWEPGDYAIFVDQISVRS